MRISDWSSDVCSSDLHVLFGKLRERHLDHPDRAFDERLARGDHRLRLLTAQHRVSNFGGVSQMGEAAFVNGDPGDLEPRDQFAAQFAADLFVIAAQRDFLMFERSEEHTSELQSLMRLSYAVFSLKKKKN